MQYPFSVGFPPPLPSCISVSSARGESAGLRLAPGPRAEGGRSAASAPATCRPQPSARRPRSRPWFGRQRSPAALRLAHEPAVATPGWGWGWGQQRLGWEGGERARASGKGWGGGGGGRRRERVSPSPSPRRRRVASGQPASPGCGRGSGGGQRGRENFWSSVCLGLGVGGGLEGAAAAAAELGKVARRRREVAGGGLRPLRLR